MGTAIARRSLWTAITDNPFPRFDAEGFRLQVLDRLHAYAERVGGRIEPPGPGDDGLILRVRLCDIPFPDGPGRAEVEVTAYRAYGRLTLAVRTDHDRLFRSLDGGPSGRLYLNDYTFVRSYEGEGTPAIEEVDEALSGFERARHAVRRRNDRNRQAGLGPRSRVRVAIRCTHSATPVPGGAAEGEDNEPALARRRADVLEALRSGTGKGPIKIRIRRRPRDDEHSSEG